MPNDETFLLLSLEEQQSKELAQVISNETARKILDYLGLVSLLQNNCHFLYCCIIIFKELFF